MKIGIATPISGFQGGLEQYSWMVASGLKRRGHFLRHLYAEAGGRQAARFGTAFDESTALSCDAAAGLDVIYVQRIGGKLQLSEFGSTPLAVASHDHSETCVRTYRYLPISGSPCHRAPGLTCVWHGCIINKRRTPGSTFGLELRNPLAQHDALIRLARRAPIIACSNYIAENLVAAGAPRARVRTVHPIPPPDAVPPVERPTANRLVVAAQLVKGKGVALAIQALAMLPQDVTLTIVGDGPSRAALEALAQRVAAKRVEFAGFVDPDAVYRHYDSARVVLVPSHWPEPFGMVGIEAMRRARPVVAARHGGIPEWAPADGAGGILFDPGSVPSLARSAWKLLQSPGAGDAALRHTEQHHDHEKMLDSLEAILTEEASLRSRTPT